jgi:hypothetical protein
MFYEDMYNERGYPLLPDESAFMATIDKIGDEVRITFASTISELNIAWIDDETY